jgi:hypothetical protein
MSVFEKGAGKEWLETMVADKLAPYDGQSAELKEHENNHQDIAVS